MSHAVDERPGRVRPGAIGNAVGRAVAGLDPVRFVGASWWLALVAIALLQQLHDGLHEHLQLAPLLHLLRDGALAVPAAAVAVAAGIITTQMLIGRDRLDGARGRLIWVASAALAFAVASIPGNALHGSLFGAEAEQELSPIADALLDGVVALIGALIALVPFALAVGSPAAPRHAPGPHPDPSRRPRQGPGDVVARSFE